MLVNSRLWFNFALYLMRDYSKELPFVGKMLFWSSLPVAVLEVVSGRRRLSRWLGPPSELRPEPLVYECFFTTDKGLRGAVTLEDKLKPASKPFTDFIQLAEKKLSMCFFSITSRDVIIAVRKARARGVQVTIVTDYGRGLRENCLVKQLHEEGTLVLAKPTEDSLMHHKFMIRDDKMLFTTSMNPTQSAMSGSFDNFLLTNDRALLDPFIRLFDKFVREFSS